MTKPPIGLKKVLKMKFYVMNTEWITNIPYALEIEAENKIKIKAVDKKLLKRAEEMSSHLSELIEWLDGIEEEQLNRDLMFLS